MTITLPLEKMTVSDKIQAMESIWRSLSQQPAEVEPPPWHGDVLAVREARASNGTSRYDDWDNAKRRIHATTHP
ncbi:MAG: addiction module protein [Kiritimatiellaeota bacterium]|nr:addiction module protein [Kiritimatiellota bacterium]